MAFIHTEPTPDPTSGPVPGGTPTEPGSTFGDRLRNLGSHAKSLGKEALGLGYDAGAKVASSVSDSTVVAATKIKTAALKTGGDIKDGALKVAALALDAMAGDPEKRESFSAELKKATPIIGATSKYAMAWRDYHVAKSTDDSVGMEKAKAQVLIAFAEGGLDLSMFGVARVAHSTRILGKGLTVLTALRSQTAVENYRLGVMEAASVKMLQSPVAQKIVTGFLDTIKPVEKTSETKKEDVQS